MTTASTGMQSPGTQSPGVDSVSRLTGGSQTGRADPGPGTRH